MSFSTTDCRPFAVTPQLEASHNPSRSITVRRRMGVTRSAGRARARAPRFGASGRACRRTSTFDLFRSCPRLDGNFDKSEMKDRSRPGGDDVSGGHQVADSAERQVMLAKCAHVDHFALSVSKTTTTMMMMMTTLAVAFRKCHDGASSSATTRYGERNDIK